MKAVLEININDLNSNFLEMLRSLLQKNVTEIVIKNRSVQLEEFDKSLSIEEITQSLEDSGHNTELIEEIKNGLLNSSIYTEDENQADK